MIGWFFRYRKRDGWSREKIESYQAESLKSLREYAYKNSPFYQKFHAGLTDAPLSELPVLTKAVLMKNWDEVVTDRSLKLEDVQKFVENLKKPEMYHGKYYVLNTSGTTGRKAVLIYNKDEWGAELSTSVKCHTLMGCPIKTLKVAYLNTTASRHFSALMETSLPARLASYVLISVMEPLENKVAKLNYFQPYILIGYPGEFRALAQEQIAGRLKISPAKVIGVAEVLTKEERKLFHEAWGAEVFNLYATTETGLLAMECSEHNGLHIFEDMVIVEVVDKDNKPVKPGEYGYKLLVTVLFNRTLPLIRYEIDDSVLLSEKKCSCGSSYRMIEDIRGRVEDIVYMPDRSGNKVQISPYFFFNQLKYVPIAGWQIVQETERRIKIVITGPKAMFDKEKLKTTMSGALKSLGVDEPEINVEQVAEISRTAGGKTVLIKAFGVPEKPEIVPKPLVP